MIFEDPHLAGWQHHLLLIGAALVLAGLILKD